ncbi:hypothetical protein DYB37_003317 [Aphanomyces astaci]|uniref:Kinesin-like protein n=2 Tax=Aphanomyces astaci TaxID=112090 RepID=A0A3R7F6A5_APHAT|nr:hypothetical protein DYB37_003317 [Aphanomyces astaci]
MIKETQQTIITDPDTAVEKSFTFDFSYDSFSPPGDPKHASQDIVWDDLGIKVEASMMEIYNEKVKDLFNPSSDNLKVRDHPSQGPYADGLTRSAVSSYDEITALMDAGIMARTTASTNMNATSSRAHTIFQIILTQSQVSRINLIDLAGSERAASTGATGARLKEGAAINQETLGTLRYADRAKQIKNQAVVNEDPNQMLIPSREDAALAYRPETRMLSREEADERRQKEAEMAAIREQLEENQRLLRESEETEELAKKREDQLKSIGLSTNLHDIRAKAKTDPHLLNLNEDQQMSEKLFYFFQNGPNRIGRSDADQPQTIILGGLGILKEHCVVERLEAQLTITGMPGASVVVNGDFLQCGNSRVLQHSDRLILGNVNVVIPAQRADDTASVHDWQFAMKEMNCKQMDFKDDDGGQTDKEVAEMESRIREMEARMKEAQESANVKMDKQREEWEAHVKGMQEEMKVKEMELKSQLQRTEEGGQVDKKKLAVQLADQETKLAEEMAKAEVVYERKQSELMQKQRDLEQSLQQQMRETKRLAEKKEREQLERSLLAQDLLRTIPLVKEANSICEELHKQVTFSVKLMPTKPVLAQLGHVADITDAIGTELKVLVTFQDAGTYRSVLWDIDKFDNQIYEMRDLYQVAATASVDPVMDFAVSVECPISAALLAYFRSSPVEFSVFGNVPSSSLKTLPHEVVSLDDKAATTTTASSSSPSVHSMEWMRDALAAAEAKLQMQETLLVDNSVEVESQHAELAAVRAMLLKTQVERDQLGEDVAKLQKTNRNLKDKLEASYIHTESDDASVAVQHTGTQTDEERGGPPSPSSTPKASKKHRTRKRPGTHRSHAEKIEDRRDDSEAMEGRQEEALLLASPDVAPPLVTKPPPTTYNVPLEVDQLATTALNTVVTFPDTLPMNDASDGSTDAGMLVKSDKAKTYSFAQRSTPAKVHIADQHDAIVRSSLPPIKPGAKPPPLQSQKTTKDKCVVS